MAIVGNELMKSAANVGRNTEKSTKNIADITKHASAIVAVVGGVYLIGKYIK